MRTKTSNLIAGLFLAGLVAWYLLFLKVHRDEQAFEEAANRLRQMGIAFHNSHDGTGCFLSDNGRWYSWRIQLLPFIEEDGLWARMTERGWKQDWDKDPQWLPCMPKFYRNPRYPAEEQDKGMTYFRAVVGPNTVVGTSSDGVSIRAMVSARTILIVEAAEPTPWTKPEDLVIDPNLPLPKFGPNGRDFLALFADGSVRVIPTDTDEKVLRMCFDYTNTRPFVAPGEVIEHPARRPGMFEKVKKAVSSLFK